MSQDSEAELVEAVVSSDIVRTGDVLNYFSVVTPARSITLSYHMGIVDYSPSDQVVTVRSGTKFNALQKALASHGQCIPHRWPLKVAFGETEIGNMIDFNLPHALEGQCGTWRDWVLGLRVVLAAGTTCTAGSHAVKNVAGYDVQKLFIGARGTLGILSQITLKTFPIGALPTRSILYGTKNGNHPIYIHRTLPSRFEALCDDAGERLIAGDPGTGTVWAGLEAQDSLKSEPGDWVIRSGCGEKNLQITEPTRIRLMKRAKEIFDPTHKLNPGEMGIF